MPGCHRDLQKSHSIWRKLPYRRNLRDQRQSLSDARGTTGGMNVAEMAPDTEGATMATAEVRQETLRHPGKDPGLPAKLL